MEINPWLSLAVASVLEIGWALGLKYTDEWRKFWPTVITIALIILTYIFLERAIRTIPLGTAYAIWTGAGAVGTALLGMMIFGEAANLPRILCILLIVSGVIGLKLTASH